MPRVGVSLEHRARRVSYRQQLTLTVVREAVAGAIGVADPGQQAAHVVRVLRDQAGRAGKLGHPALLVVGELDGARAPCAHRRQPLAAVREGRRLAVRLGDSRQPAEIVVGLEASLAEPPRVAGSGNRLDAARLRQRRGRVEHTVAVEVREEDGHTVGLKEAKPPGGQGLEAARVRVRPARPQRPRHALEGVEAVVAPDEADAAARAREHDVGLVEPHVARVDVHGPARVGLDRAFPLRAVGEPLGRAGDPKHEHVAVRDRRAQPRGLHPHAAHQVADVPHDV